MFEDSSSSLTWLAVFNSFSTDGILILVSIDPFVRFTWCFTYLGYYLIEWRFSLAIISKFTSPRSWGLSWKEAKVYYCVFGKNSSPSISWLSSAGASSIFMDITESWVSLASYELAPLLSFVTIVLITSFVFWLRVNCFKFISAVISRILWIVDLVFGSGTGWRFLDVSWGLITLDDVTFI